MMYQNTLTTMVLSCLSQKLYVLFCRCHGEDKRKQEYVSNEALCERLIGFTMFMGELFLNMTVSTDIIYVCGTKIV